AYDSHNTFSPSATAVVTTAAANNTPTVKTHEHQVHASTTVALSTLFSYSDPDAGDSVTMFAVKDRTIGGGYLTLNGVAQAENTLFDSIPISQIGQWAYVANASPTRRSSDLAYDSHNTFSPSATAVVTTAAANN